MNQLYLRNNLKKTLFKVCHIERCFVILIHIFLAAAVQWPVHGPERPSAIFFITTRPLLCEPLIPKHYKHDANLLNGLLRCYAGVCMNPYVPTDNFKLISKVGWHAASTALKKERERQKERKSRMESLSYWNICHSISVRAENISAPLRKNKRMDSTEKQTPTTTTEPPLMLDLLLLSQNVLSDLIVFVSLFDL